MRVYGELLRDSRICRRGRRIAPRVLRNIGGIGGLRVNTMSVNRRRTMPMRSCWIRRRDSSCRGRPDGVGGGSSIDRCRRTGLAFCQGWMSERGICSRSTRVYSTRRVGWDMGRELGLGIGVVHGEVVASGRVRILRHTRVAVEVVNRLGSQMIVEPVM